MFVRCSHFVCVIRWSHHFVCVIRRTMCYKGEIFVCVIGGVILYVL